MLLNDYWLIVCVDRSCNTTPSLCSEGYSVCFDICWTWSRVWKAVWGHCQSKGKERLVNFFSLAVFWLIFSIDLIFLRQWFLTAGNFIWDNFGRSWAISFQWEIQGDTMTGCGSYGITHCTANLAIWYQPVTAKLYFFTDIDCDLWLYVGVCNK